MRYTVLCAYYDTDNRATVEVEAENYADACEKAVILVNDGEVSTTRESFDPVETFVYGVVEGDDDPWAGNGNVPLEYTEEHALGLRWEPWERRGPAVYTEGTAEPGTALLIADLHGLPNAVETANSIVAAHNNFGQPNGGAL